MKLTKYLRDAGYDLIGGPVRNHRLLQLWLKTPFNKAEMAYLEINHAFSSQVELPIAEDPALSVNATKTDEYAYNIGISMLEDVLKSLGLGAFDLKSKIDSGKTVTISYDNSVTKVVPVGDVINYLSSADFKYPNPVLLKHANEDNLILITGVVLAKNLVVDIETKIEIDAELVASLNQAADGKLDFKMSSQQKLRMVSSGDGFFPIAVKADRINFDKGVFQGLTLLTDTRSIF